MYMEQDVIKEVNEIIGWFHSHVSELTSDDPDIIQVQCLHEHILPRLQTFRSDVKKALHSR